MNDCKAHGIMHHPSTREHKPCIYILYNRTMFWACIYDLVRVNVLKDMAPPPPPFLFVGPWGWGNGGEVCSILSPRFLSPTSHRDFINAFSAHLFLRLSFFSHRITIVRFVTWPSPIPLNPCAKVVNDHMDSIPYSPLKMHCVHLLCALNTEEPSLHFTINS